MICASSFDSLEPSSLAGFMMLGFRDVTVLSWNIWGALNKMAKRHLMDLIRRFSPTFVIIMETHGAFKKTEFFWSRAGYMQVEVVEARGQSGGLWILKQNDCNVVTTTHDVFRDTVTLKLSLGSDSWFLTGMYASPFYSTRLELWNYLVTLKDSIVGPWFIIGDYNEITLPSEQRGGNFNQARADALLRTIDTCQLRMLLLLVALLLGLEIV